MKPRFRLRRTTYLCVFFVFIILGIGLARSGQATQLGLLPLGLLLLLIGRRKPVILICGLVLCGLTLGWWRGEIVYSDVAQYRDLDGQKIVIEVRADTEAVYGKNGQLSFDAGDVQLAEPYAGQLPGRIGVSGFGEQTVYRGDRVVVEGKLRLGRGSKQAYVSYATLQVNGHDTSKLESMRREFLAGLQNALPEPLASFAGGLLIGQRATLPDSVNEQLAIVGLTHIIAVSGYNLTIIVRAVRRGSRKLSKYQSTVICFTLIGAFLLVTGFSASIVRASIVSGLSLLAWYYGRRFRPILLILMTAVITGLWSPLYVWSDIGWYLSFLAFYGVMIVAPLLQKRLFGDKEPKLIGMVALESFSAQLMTAPFILWIFHQTSLVAPLTNLLIVPLVPLAMLLSLVAGISGMLFPVVAGWFAWPATLLLTYILDVVALFSRIPKALIDRSLSLPGMLLCYGSIVVVVTVLKTRLRRKYGIITDKETII